MYPYINMSDVLVCDLMLLKWFKINNHKLMKTKTSPAINLFIFYFFFSRRQEIFSTLSLSDHFRELYIAFMSDSIFSCIFLFIFVERHLTPICYMSIFCLIFFSNCLISYLAYMLYVCWLTLSLLIIFFLVASHDGDKKVEYKNEEGLIIAQ